MEANQDGPDQSYEALNICLGRMQCKAQDWEVVEFMDMEKENQIYNNYYFSLN